MNLKSFFYYVMIISLFLPFYLTAQLYDEDINWGIYYHNNPNELNGVNNRDAAIQEYRNFRAVVWPRGFEDPANGYHNDLVYIINALTHGTNNTECLGNVYLNESEATVKSHINQWVDTGASGIIFTAFEQTTAGTNLLRNMIDYCHYSNTNWIKVFLYVNPYSFTNFGAGDAYLLLDVFVRNGQYVDGGTTNILHNFNADLDLWVAANGNSTLSHDTSIYQAGGGSLKIDYNTPNQWDEAGGMRWYNPYQDWSSYSAFHFGLRGDGTANMTVYVYIYQDNDNNGSYDDVWYYAIPNGISGTNWQSVDINWANFADPIWDTDIASNQTTINPQNIQAISIRAQNVDTVAHSGSYWIDEVGLQGTGSSGSISRCYSAFETRKKLGCDIYMLDSQLSNASLATFNAEIDKIDYSYWGAMIFGFDRFGFSDYWNYGAQNQILYHYNQFQTNMGNFFVDTNVIDVGGGLYKRDTDQGTIYYNIAQHKGYFVKYGIYYVSLTGNDANSGTNISEPFRHIWYAETKVGPGNKVFILPGTYDENITVDVSGTPGRLIRFEAYSNGVVIDGSSGTAPCITVQGAENLRFKGLKFVNTVSNGLVIDNVSSSIQVENCTFSNVSGNALKMEGGHNTFYSNVFVNNTVGVYLFSDSASGNVFVDNTIKHNTQNGVVLSGADGNIFTECTISSNGADGINISVSGVNNVISHSLLVNNDGDGVDSSGNNTIIENLTVYDSGGYGIKVAGSGDTIVNNVTMSNSSGGYNSTSSLNIDYSSSYGETSLSGSAVAGTSFVTGQNPLFVKVPNDFRLQIHSPCLTNSNPVAVSGNRGAHTVFIGINYAENGTQDHTIRFTTTAQYQGIPSRGTIIIDYPPGYKLSSVIDSSTIDGNFIVIVNGNELVIHRMGNGNDRQGGRTEELVIHSVSNVSATGTNTVRVKILDENDFLIEDLGESQLFVPLENFKGPFYVHSTLGNDSNMGSAQYPFKTVSKALSVMNNTTINTCYVAGTFSAVTVTVTNTLGTTSNPLVFTAWSNDTNPWVMTNSPNRALYFNKNGVKNIIFKHLIIKNPTSDGIRVDSVISNITFISNQFLSGSGSGVYFYTGDNSAHIVFKNTIFSNFSHGFRKNRIMNDIGFSNCRFLNHSSSAIYLYDNTTSQVKIKNSYFSNNAIAFHGSTGSLTDIVFYSNICVNNGDYSVYLQPSAANIVFKKNKIFGNTTAGLLALDLLQNLTLQSNIFVNTGQYGFSGNKAGSSFLEDVKNNVFAGNTSIPFYLYDNFNSCTIRNNVFDLSGSGDTIAYLRTSGTINFRNNILLGPANYGIRLLAGSIVNGYNDIVNVTTPYSGTSAGSGALSINPKFITTNKSQWLSEDFYRLDKGSPCIDAGDPGDDGLPEVFGSHIDMGAFESTNLVLNPNLYLTNSYSVTGPGGVNKYVPGNTIIISVYYDNDDAYATNVSITVSLPSNTTYVSNSASINNAYHTGESGTMIEVFDGNSWISDSGVYNIELIQKIRWFFNHNVSNNENSESTDTIGKCDGDFPDNDAGVVTYKVIIK